MGGLDSSILVSEMSKIQENPIKTFTIGFKEKGFNEFEYAKAVSEHLETNHTETELDADSYLEAMLKMIAIKDAPLAVPNEIALHKMSLVLKRDISVVLSVKGLMNYLVAMEGFLDLLMITREWPLAYQCIVF